MSVNETARKTTRATKQTPGALQHNALAAAVARRRGGRAEEAQRGVGGNAPEKNGLDHVRTRREGEDDIFPPNSRYLGPREGERPESEIW